MFKKEKNLWYFTRPNHPDIIIDVNTGQINCNSMINNELKYEIRDRLYENLHHRSIISNFIDNCYYNHDLFELLTNKDALLFVDKLLSISDCADHPLLGNGFFSFSKYTILNRLTMINNNISDFMKLFPHIKEVLPHEDPLMVYYYYKNAPDIFKDKSIYFCYHWGRYIKENDQYLSYFKKHLTDDIIHSMNTFFSISDLFYMINTIISQATEMNYTELPDYPLFKMSTIVTKNYRVFKDAKRTKNIKIVFDKYKTLTTYKSNEYSIEMPLSTEDLIKEGNVQNNCVGGYADAVAEGDSIIVFIRKNNTPYITCEIDPRTGRIVQALLKYNHDITDIKDRNFIVGFQTFLFSYFNIDIEEEEEDYELDF